MPRILQAIKKHKVTHVVHSAAFVGAVSAANPALSIQVNVMGLVNVLEAARALDVQRVVFTSAKGVYGPVTGEYGAPTWKPMSEDLPAKPKRIYDSAKFMGENVCTYYHDNMGLDTISLRFASTYRVGQVFDARMDVRELGLKRGEYEVREIRKDGKVVLEGSMTFALGPAAPEV